MDTYLKEAAHSVGNSEVEKEIEEEEVEENKKMQLCYNCSNIVKAKAKLADHFCIKCEEKLCVSCSQVHTTKSGHLTVSLNKQQETKKFKESEFCTAHEERLAEVYCISCREIICTECEKKSHSSHNCSNVEKAAVLVSKQAETEYENLSDLQLHFDKERERLSNEEIRVIKTVKEVEIEIRKRCDEMTKFICNETNALLKELDSFRKERLEEIEIERLKLDEHVFTFEKFKVYCDQIKSNINPRYTCEAEGVLRNIADDLKSRPEGRWKSRLFAIDVSLQKTDIEQVLTSLSDAVGKLIIRCPYQMTQSSEVELDVAEVHDMAILHDKLYLLSNFIFIRRLEYPFESVGEIKIPEIKSPTEIVSCLETSCLYIYDKGVDCIWKVSIPSQQVSRWLSDVKEPRAISVTSNAELLMVRNNRPICLEVYNEDAILSRRLNFPAAIPSLRRLYETSSGGYIGQGELNVFQLRRNGSLIGQFEPSKDRECMGNPICFNLSPYHIFLHCGSDGQHDTIPSVNAISSVPNVRTRSSIRSATTISSMPYATALCTMPYVTAISPIGLGLGLLSVNTTSLIPSVRATSSMRSATTESSMLPVTALCTMPYVTAIQPILLASAISSMPSVTVISSISSVSSDLAHHQILRTCHHITPVKSCYLKKAKKLLVLEKDVSNITTSRMFLRVYNILPA